MARRRSLSTVGPRLAVASLLASGLVASGLGGCFGAGAPLERVVDEGPEEDGTAAATASASSGAPDPGPTDPHGASGIDPPHGSFAGGLRAIVRGNGFRDGMTVSIGGAPATGVTVLGPTRVQVATPPGVPGPADVTTELAGDPSTRRTLAGAYTYDAFHLEPDDGPTSGGIVTRIVGRGTSWGTGTSVLVGGSPCTSLEVASPEELLCEVPPGTLGSKPVRVAEGEDAITVLDAFTYDDAPQGTVGGLAGAPLDGRMEVRAFGAFTGEPLAGATVVLGDDLDTGIVAITGEDGRVVVEDDALGDAVTVTVALFCHHPITFVDVGVDRAHVYLDPIFDPACVTDIELPPPGGSGAGSSKGSITGQIHWDYVNEFQRGPFAVPAPGPDERVVAYVLTASGSPGGSFALPPASQAITPEADGTIGYAFDIPAAPGNRVLYALAGLEDRSGSLPRFVPWSMGVLRGVVVAPGVATEDVAIHMRFPLELALEVELAPPAPTDRGPDRLLVTSSIRVGTEGWLPLPQGKAPRLLPLTGTVDFVGLPLLDGALQGASYAVSARAGTGAGLLLPLSVVADVTSSVAGPIAPGPFVGVPSLTTPVPGGVWDGRNLAFELSDASSAADVVVLEVATPSDLVRWRIAAPGSRREVRVPDLRVLGLGLPMGPLQVVVAAGRIEGLSWDELQYRHLRTQNMDAFAIDTFDARW